MLTQRQQRLLMLLMSAEGWVTSAQLAERLAVSAKLVKTEVGRIRAQLGDRVAIESSNARGYRLARLDEQAREEARASFRVHSGHHSIKHAYALVFLYLLMQDAPVSHVHLADRLYCSRAAIAHQVDLIRYRIGRLPHLALTVSQAQGVMIEGEEWARRYEASKWMRSDCLETVFGVDAAYGELTGLKRALERVCCEYLEPWVSSERLSGGDAIRIGRYLALSVARSRAGHVCPAAPEGGDAAVEPAFALELAHRLAELVRGVSGYAMSPQEISCTAMLVGDLAFPEEADESAHRLAESFVEHVRAVTGFDLALDVSALAARMGVVTRRMASGRTALNYHGSETVARYPLSFYLLSSFFKEREGIAPNKAECAALAAYIAGAVSRACQHPAAELHTNEGMLAAEHLRYLIEGELGFAPVTIRPCWAPPTECGAVVLTTDPAFSADHAGCVLMPALPTASELERVRAQVAQLRAGRLEGLRGDLVRLEHGAPVPTETLARDAALRDTAVMAAYGTLCFLRRGEGRKSVIDINELGQPFTFEGKSYRRVMRAFWNGNTPDAASFFGVLCMELSNTVKDAR